LLCCFSLCFVAPCASLLLLLRCSLCFITFHVSLLLLLLCCSSSCFTPTPCASLLLFIFCSPTTLLLCCVLLLLHSLLLYCPPRYLSAPCCFATLLCFAIAWCFHCSLAQIGIPSPLFLNGEIRICLGRSLRASKLPINLFRSLCFFFEIFFLIFFP
jgi:hypothetical protein